MLDRYVGELGVSLDELSGEGIAVELLDAFVVPDDQVAFCLFATGSRATVEQACRRAGVPFERITAAVTSSMSTSLGTRKESLS